MAGLYRLGHSHTGLDREQSHWTHTEKCRQMLHQWVSSGLQVLQIRDCWFGLCIQTNVYNELLWNFLGAYSKYWEYSSKMDLDRYNIYSFTHNRWTGLICHQAEGTLRWMTYTRCSHLPGKGSYACIPRFKYYTLHTREITNHSEVAT